jgi:hypothetical protein
LQHVFDVCCSGVSATTKRFASMFISPTPMNGMLPLLATDPGLPVIVDAAQVLQPVADVHIEQLGDQRRAAMDALRRPRMADA